MSAQALARADAAAVIDRLRPSIAAAQRGDQAAFRLLYQEYARSVYNLAFRSLRNPQAAEDACQEIWVKAFRELPKLQDPQAFPAWLYRIAGRACVDAARHSRRLPATAELPEDRLAHADDDDPERSALRRERVSLTWEAMATMPARQHVALYLREIESLPYKEIAQMLKSSEAAVEMLLFRARRGFAKAYEQLETATQDRCLHARRSMAAIMDGEATPVQQTAIRAHVDACLPCSGELTQMRRTAAAYSALLPVPVPALLGERILESIGAPGASAAVAPTAIAKILGLAAVKAKVAALTLVATAATTAATVAAMNSPIADEIRPGPSSTHSEIQAEKQAGGSTGSNSGSTGTEAGAAQYPAAQDQSAPLPLDPNIPGLTDTVDQLTAPVTSIVDQTTADLSSSLDGINNELNGITGEVPAVPPVEIDTPPIPTLPELPLPTPTIPALPLLP